MCQHESRFALCRAHDEHDCCCGKPYDHGHATGFVNSVTCLLWHLSAALQQHSNELRQSGRCRQPESRSGSHSRPKMLCEVEGCGDPGGKHNFKSHEELCAPASETGDALVLGHRM